LLASALTMRRAINRIFQERERLLEGDIAAKLLEPAAFGLTRFSSALSFQRLDACFRTTVPGVGSGARIT
jgi:hypothetical protein